MPHSEPRRTHTRCTIAVAIFALALAIFGWGLHSKLSLYHAPQRTQLRAPIAKLLSERERPAAVAALNQHPEPQRLATQLKAFATVLFPLRANRPWQRDVEVPPPCAGEAAFTAPMLRRPPPFLFA